MLQFFRKALKSRIGIPFAMLFLALMAFAFTGSDVSSSTLFGGVSAGDKVAVVGKQRLTEDDLSQTTTLEFEATRQQNPTLTLQAYVAGGGMTQALDSLLARTAIAEFGRRHGLEVGAPLLGAALAKVPAFQGLDGKFSQENYNAALQQSRRSDASVQDEFTGNLFARQVLTPVALAPQMPDSFVSRYASLLRERRKGAIAVLPTELFAPTAKPTDAQLSAFYQANRSKFIRPERRVIRYAAFGEDIVGTLPPPTEAQVAQRYQRDRVQYAASESRTVTQLVLPTQAAAQAIASEVNGGKSLDAAAREKGLRAIAVGPVDRRALTTQASAAIADAAFKAAKGALVGPVRGSLGWYVLRVDAVTVAPQRTLEQVRGEIGTALAEEQRAAALANLTAQIEEEFDAGTSLVDAAKKHGLTLATTPLATADGRLYGKEGETLPAELAPVLKTAFQMDEGEPQLAALEGGKAFMVFEAVEIVPSATAPLAEIRDDVTEAWKFDEGDKAAKAAADRILARVAKGATLADALRAENPKLAPAETIDQSREELARAGRVPPQLALFFSMASGTAKKIAAGSDRGWFVVRVDSITPGTVAKDDPLLRDTSRQLAQVQSGEYIAQFVQAAQDDVGVERNQKAIEALTKRLSGQGS